MNIKTIFKKMKLRKLGVEILDISKGAFKHYKEDVKGNLNEDDSIAELKILRNWKLGRQYFADDRVIKKGYGNLTLTLDRKTNTITNIKNRKGDIINKSGKIVDTYKDVDRELKKKLNEIIGG